MGGGNFPKIANFALKSRLKKWPKIEVGLTGEGGGPGAPPGTPPQTRPKQLPPANHSIIINNSLLVFFMLFFWSG